jgi:hypothetical protein
MLPVSSLLAYPTTIGYLGMTSTVSQEACYCSHPELGRSLSSEVSSHPTKPAMTGEIRSPSIKRPHILFITLQDLSCPSPLQNRPYAKLIYIYTFTTETMHSRPFFTFLVTAVTFAMLASPTTAQYYKCCKADCKDCILYQLSTCDPSICHYPVRGQPFPTQVLKE